MSDKKKSGPEKFDADKVADLAWYDESTGKAVRPTKATAKKFKS